MTVFLRGRGLLPVLLAVMLAAGLAAGLAAPAGSAPALRPVAETVTPSAITKTGTGAFSSLKVTVGQTTNLVDQVVPVTWSGGAETQPNTAFAINYLQIMQCWGDAKAGPDPDQCEFGGSATFDTRGGTWTTTRQLNYGTTLSDPLEKLPNPLPASGIVYMPFRSVTGVAPVEGNTNPFWDSSTTNEIPFARTRGDGNGQEYFETQTNQEAPGLGCGLLVGGKPRSCWLVVVPRGDTEVDGSKRDTSNINQQLSSPLSPSNWKNRLVFPLHFAPVGDVCPIGGAERRTVGVENVDEAIIRWQPTLCQNSGPVYGFSQVVDFVANRTVLADPPNGPNMAFVTSPVVPNGSADRQLYYAPVALSGLTISYLIESQSGPNAPPAVRARDGERITSLNLTPRLVAKLLTQSYQLGVNATARYLKDNPADMTRDPDFLRFNPQFKDLQFRTPIADILVPEATSTTNELLWQWIAADPDARAFIAGQSDPWGMRINPFYQGISIPQLTFPKQDPFCQTFTVGSPPPAPLCTLDAHPYAADMHEAARSASRGDGLSRSAWDPFGMPPAYKKAALQLNGQRALLALSDSATAARYSLTSAKLLNASGQFVAPNAGSILKGEQAMKSTAVPGVKAADPNARVSGAYPLVQVTYATTAPSALKVDEAEDYADLIRYAAGPGQVPGFDPGELPVGYVPLPTSLRAQATFVAGLVQARAGGKQPTPPQTTPTTTPTAPVTSNDIPTDTSGVVDPGVDSGSSDTGDGTDTGPPTDTSSPTADATPSPAASSPTPSASASDTGASAVNKRVSAITPVANAGAVRYVLIIVLALGCLAAAGGPALPLLRRRIGRSRP